MQKIGSPQMCDQQGRNMSVGLRHLDPFMPMVLALAAMMARV